MADYIDEKLVEIYDRHMDATGSGATEARREALEAIAAEMEGVDGMLSAPPSEKEAAYIAAISTRSNMTRDECNAALRQYTGHAAQRAVLDAAKRSGLYVDGLMTNAEGRKAELEHKAELVERHFTPAMMAQAAREGVGIVRGDLRSSPEQPGDDLRSRFYGMIANSGSK